MWLIKSLDTCFHRPICWKTLYLASASVDSRRKEDFLHLARDFEAERGEQQVGWVSEWVRAEKSVFFQWRVKAGHEKVFTFKNLISEMNPPLKSFFFAQKKEGEVRERESQIRCKALR